MDNGRTNDGRGTWDRILRCHGNVRCPGSDTCRSLRIGSAKAAIIGRPSYQRCEEAGEGFRASEKIELQRSRVLGWQARARTLHRLERIVPRIISALWGLRIASRDGPARISQSSLSRSRRCISDFSARFGRQFSPVISKHGK